MPQHHSGFCVVLLQGRGRQGKISLQTLLRKFTPSRFECLCRVLPSRFQKDLEMVRAGLPLLFLPTYSMVLNHGDLSEMNLLVDPSTGHINGVIDWAEAEVSPFGISLWGLENVLGSMTSKGWRYHPHHYALRAQFWRTFEEAVGGISDDDRKRIHIARIPGLFLQYGFASRGEQEPVKEETVSFKHLDAFCATDIQQTQQCSPLGVDVKVTHPQSYPEGIGSE